MKYVFSMEQLRERGLSTEESFEILKNTDLTNTRLFYADGSCTYEVLVEKSNGTEIEGIELSASSHYPNATYPEPIFSLLAHTKVDLKDPDVYPDSIMAMKAGEEDFNFIEEQRAKQQSFIKDMVSLPKNARPSQYYQAVSIAPNDNWPSYFDVQLLNISGVYNGIPYVMDRELVISDAAKYDEAVRTYGSCEGNFLPDTRMRFKLPDGEIFYHYKEVKENPELVTDKLTGDYKILVTALFEEFKKHEYKEE